MTFGFHSAVEVATDTIDRIHTTATSHSRVFIIEEGLNVVTLPKTIDNDLWGTDMTFGFQSAVDIATDTIDRIHTTATSHSRVLLSRLWVTKLVM